MMKKKAKRSIKIKYAQWHQLQKQLRQRTHEAQQYEAMYWKAFRKHCDTQGQLIVALQEKLKLKHE